MAEGWPAAVLKAPRALSASNPAVLDVEAAGIVRAPSASPLNILHVLRAPLGGLFRHVVDLVQGQAARGHRVGLIVDSTTGGARAEAALAGLAPHLALGVLRVAIGRELGPSDIQALRRASGWTRQAAPDVLHGHGAKGAALARLNLERTASDPRLHATWRLSGLPARNDCGRVLSHARMAPEVAHGRFLV